MKNILIIEDEWKEDKEKILVVAPAFHKIIFRINRMKLGDE